MITLLERVAIEVVVSLCVGAVVGLMSGRWLIADEPPRQNRRQPCPHCDAAATTEALPNEGGTGSGH